MPTPSAWPSLISVQTPNTAVPDSAAPYRVRLIVATDPTTISITGHYPDARYFSLSTYTPYGSPFTSNGIGSPLPGYRITARPGSVNPWQPLPVIDVAITTRVTSWRCR
jgi:hypothetical protein